MHHHDAGCFVHTFPLFRSMQWYACHSHLCHPLASYASLHTCLHVHAWVLLVCHPYLHVYVCLLLCFMPVIASLVLGFATLDALNGFVVVWLLPTPMRPCLDVTIWDTLPWCRLLCAYLSRFPLHVMICLPCSFVPPVGFLCIFTCLFTCPCISLAC